jgi:hypothetical protein
MENIDETELDVKQPPLEDASQRTHHDRAGMDGRGIKRQAGIA